MTTLTTPIHHGPPGLAEFAEECAADLFQTVQHTFSFPTGCSLQHWPVEQIKQVNAELLGTLRNLGNVYALFVRPATDDAQWTKVYVGQRKSVGLRERITQHLIKKDEKTGSMLEAVRTAVSSGSAIGVSFIKVQPDSLRLYVEEAIISKYKAELPWNTHG